MKTDKIYLYNIGFTVNGIENEKQFNTRFSNKKNAIVDVMNLFLEFVKENKFENVEAKYIEYVGEVESE